VRLEIFVSIQAEQPQEGHGRLEIRQVISLQPRSFLELCKILGQFEDLAHRIAEEERR
jgi:hypothetical protein